MADWSKMRATWKSERDKHVKKGAVSGVSIGDAIEAVLKGQSKGYQSMLNAVADLEKAIVKYKAKIEKTTPALTKWMDKHLGDAVKETKTAISLDLDSLKWTVDNLLAASDINILVILPDDGLLVNIDRLMTNKTNPMTWAQAVKTVQMFAAIENCGALLAKRATTLKAMKWHAKLPGHDADYKTLTEFADTAIDDVKKVIMWSKSADIGEWAQHLKVMKSKSTALDMLSYAQRAMKHLMA